jgi:hypothetical protein
LLAIDRQHSKDLRAAAIDKENFTENGSRKISEKFQIISAHQSQVRVVLGVQGKNLYDVASPGAYQLEAVKNSKIQS